MPRRDDIEQEQLRVYFSEYPTRLYKLLHGKYGIIHTINPGTITDYKTEYIEHNIYFHYLLTQDRKSSNWKLVYPQMKDGKAYYNGWP